jgi:thiol-disulfide isomerase/thioredoxin
MNTSRRNFLSIGLGSLLLTTLPAWTAFAQAKKGSRFPDLNNFKLEGDLPDLSGKVLLVDFWASWCGPCRKAMPAVAKLHETYQGQGLVVLGISIDDSASDMEGFLKKNPVPFTTLRDPKGHMAKALDVKSIPTSFIVGSDGRIHGVHVGFNERTSPAKYAADIEAALGLAKK